MPSHEDPGLPPDEEGFSIEEAMRVQRGLREALGLGAERFPLPAFVGMISDEIEQLREAGRSDRDIADLIAALIGRGIAPEDLARHYAPADRRHGAG